MRKLFLATASVFLMAGLAYAVDVIVLRYNAETKEVVVKEGDKEVTYKIAENVKVILKDKEGNTKEGSFKILEGRLKLAGKGKAGGPKLDVTVKDGTITEVTLPAFGKKGKGGN
ncbi:MAG: hypothetical protein WHU94_03785 [Thermogemmata sp.]|jgi:uncharacterized protein with FMN-binding domain|uniref:Uncharacterized protein n=1 Tax=Thermogemmata fonticola TaxID=2755323 RepID=A0A7V8VFA3_9BACT|nr:hypothetical protein [Thermogemmata fonticola]MBA2226877.1 hypothetical protein [Thermogemmata fonticola]MCX8140341.1 hypothetical protein [Gemmataceae bacterium]